jgi:hypothetical protein
MIVVHIHTVYLIPRRLTHTQIMKRRHTCEETRPAKKLPPCDVLFLQDKDDEIHMLPVSALTRYPESMLSAMVDDCGAVDDTIQLPEDVQGMAAYIVACYTVGVNNVTPPGAPESYPLADRALRYFGLADERSFVKGVPVPSAWALERERLDMLTTQRNIIIKLVGALLPVCVELAVAEANPADLIRIRFPIESGWPENTNTYPDSPFDNLPIHLEYSTGMKGIDFRITPDEDHTTSLCGGFADSAVKPSTIAALFEEYVCHVQASSEFTVSVGITRNAYGPSLSFTYKFVTPPVAEPIPSDPTPPESGCVIS